VLVASLIFPDEYRGSNFKWAQAPPYKSSQHSGSYSHFTGRYTSAGETASFSNLQINQFVYLYLSVGIIYTTHISIKVRQVLQRINTNIYNYEMIYFLQNREPMSSLTSTETLADKT
jgi:hypothetical protein